MFKILLASLIGALLMPLIARVVGNTLATSAQFAVRVAMLLLLGLVWGGIALEYRHQRSGRVITA